MLTAARPDAAAQVRAVAGRLVAHLDELLPELGATYRREIAGYARLTDAQLEAQVLATSRRLVEGYFGRLAQGRDPARVDLTAMQLVGRRRLEMGLSLDDALHAFRLAAREVWRALTQVVVPGEETAVLTLASGWIDRIDQVSSRVATGYLEASHDRLRRLDARRHEVVTALLAAADDGEVAAVGEQHAVTLAACYRPVVLVGGEALTRSDTVLASLPDALVDHLGDRLLVLLPATGADGDDDPHRLATLARAERAVVGHPAPPGRALSEEVRRTRLLAGHTAAADPVVDADDLPLERLLVAAGPDATAPLAARLRALDDRPDLRLTLEHYLDTGAVPTVAAQLGIHANTVAHRLRRVAQLTGLDPRVPRQAAVLALALAADAPTPGAPR